MHFRKRGFPQQNIEGRFAAEKGQINWTYGLFMVLFLALYLFAALQLERFRTASFYLEDALTASNLASAIVDVEEFGISHKIQIDNVAAVYEVYQNAVRENLNLDEEWMAAAGGVIEGRVRVMNYSVYNVDGDEVTLSCFDEHGIMSQQQFLLGEARAPDGKLIESTSVYSEIAFMVKVFPGKYVEARKGCLVDVVR